MRRRDWAEKQYARMVEDAKGHACVMARIAAERYATGKLDVDALMRCGNELVYLRTRVAQEDVPWQTVGVIELAAGYPVPRREK